jgi:hypothetical protein
VTLIFGYSYQEVCALGNIEKLLGINLFNLNKFGPSAYSGDFGHLNRGKSAACSG